jgi:hypothetical protein
MPVVWSTKDRKPWIADGISEWFHSNVVGELPSISATFGTDYDWVPPFQGWTIPQRQPRPATWAVDFRAFGPLGALLEIWTHPFSLGYQSTSALPELLMSLQNCSSVMESGTSRFCLTTTAAPP